MRSLLIATKKILSHVLIGAVLTTSGCAHFPVNAPLATVDPRAGYRFRNAASPTNSEDLLLILAFSGGGTRASAVAYGVLEELAHTQVGRPNERHRLLDEVDAISSVSGGSFTAAFYALWGDKTFSDFERKFLKKNVATTLICRTLYPWNWVRLASPSFSRIDLAAEYYDRSLFRGATFGDLATRSGRPFVVLNATDIALGERFEFTQDQFDLIGSDLSKFPIGRAVAASSAFPVLLSPVVLKNYATERHCPEPEWIRSALTDSHASDRRRSLALAERTYINDPKRCFVHLFDGGITDNLGLRGVVDGAIAHDGTSSTLRDFHMGMVRRIAVIIVDAHASIEFGWDSSESSPRFPAMIRSISQVPISRSSSETLALFKELAFGMGDGHGHTDADSSTSNLSLYTIELHFARMADDSDREYFNSVPTRFQLPAETVDRLRRMAAAELAKNEEFRRLVRDLERQPGS